MRLWKLANKVTESTSPDWPPGASPALLQIMRARGIYSENDWRLFLNPPHRLPYCPLRMSGMEPALQRLHQALPSSTRDSGEKETVGIVGDFDVDGITGAAILVEALEGLGIPTIPYLPHRVTEGHGLSEEAVHQLAGKGVSLVITVDCGVSSRTEAALARKLGMDVIITDHHAPPEEPPEVTAIVNPRMPGDEYPFPHLCGAGLAFKLMQGLHQRLGKSLPSSLMELAALGTIADVVPLTDENRYLVKQGLKEINRTRRTGLQAMFQVSGLAGKPVNAETVMFQIAPRLNSAGRMGHAADSLLLLTTHSSSVAATLAQQLEAQNKQRQELTREVYASAHSFVAGLEELPPFLVVNDPMLTPGVAGLVAGRLAEEFRRPAVALAQVDDQTWVASGRSIPGFNLIEAFRPCSDLFVRYGGHSQAAGFSIKREKLGELQSRLCEIALKQLEGIDLSPVVYIDTEIGFSELTSELVAWLEELEPFGEANPKPVFLTRNLVVVQVSRIGNAGQHLSMLVSDGGKSLPALLFNRSNEWDEAPDKVDLVYTLTVDYWRGRKQVSLIIEDFAPAVAGKR